MEARIHRAAVSRRPFDGLLLLAAVLLVSMGARQRSANFIVETPDPNFAQQVAQAAEKYRHDLAVEWLGKAMPNWSQPCVMTVQVGPHLGAGGATTFVFDRGEVFGWRMSIQGSPRADPRFGPAARNHPHDLRQPLPPAAAALGRRGRGHQRRARQREEQAPRRCSTSSSAPAAASPSTRCSP